ncbi:hypothetical protein DFH07DRAFT_93269 [Mycena maculata]|uniref:Uncharacterized protein n=1 Tax=Mycena maculata TaxID=230809 RepID=A0AAD7I933_9AGAR|nr:hypothetical protein DFH07DRAFT_93269 [Mycena maculata]
MGREIRTFVCCPDTATRGSWLSRANDIFIKSYGLWCRLTCPFISLEDSTRRGDLLRAWNFKTPAESSGRGGRINPIRLSGKRVSSQAGRIPTARLSGILVAWSVRWPASPSVEAMHLGFPSIAPTVEMRGYSWDASVYAGLRRFHRPKELDLVGTARTSYGILDTHLFGYPGIWRCRLDVWAGRILGRVSIQSAWMMKMLETRFLRGMETLLTKTQRSLPELETRRSHEAFDHSRTGACISV